MGSRMASAASLLDCKIRNAQNTQTEGGLQQHGTPSSQRVKKCAHWAAPVGRLLDQGDGTSAENQAQCNAILTKQVMKAWHVYSSPLVARRAEISGSSPKPVPYSYSRHPRGLGHNY